MSVSRELAKMFHTEDYIIYTEVTEDYIICTEATDIYIGLDYIHRDDRGL